MTDEIPHKQTGRASYEWVGSLVGVVVAVVVVFTFAVRLMGVSGESMRETLQDGDWLVVVNHLLSGDPEAGDIVLLRKENFNNGRPLVKRVIATAGQTVEIDFSAGMVYVDGDALEEPYIREPTQTPEGVAFPLTVPDGCVFVLGDNRNHSSDSRHSDLGPIDVRQVIGKAVFLALPGKTAESDQREWGRVGPLK